MPAATPAQIQSFADTRVRPHAEAARGLAQALLDDIASISDVYIALTTGTQTWTDSRQDAPPHLLQGSDILAFNTFMHDISNAITTHPQYPIVLEACVRPLIGNQ